MKLLNPGLYEDQANNHFHRNFKKKHKGRIKPKVVISQKKRLGEASAKYHNSSGGGLTSIRQSIFYKNITLEYVG